MYRGAAGVVGVEVVRNLVLRISHKHAGGVSLVRLMCLVFLVDREHRYRYGVPLVTDWGRGLFGPVSRKVFVAVESLELSGRLHVIVGERGGIFYSSTSPGRLDERTAAVVDEVVEKYRGRHILELLEAVAGLTSSPP